MSGSKESYLFIGIGGMGMAPSGGLDGACGVFDCWI